MRTVLVVIATLLAGGLGAVLRAQLTARAPHVGMAAANVAGTLLLALVLVAHDDGVLDGWLALVLGVGLSGSLTTFSGWMALLVDGAADRPWRTVVVDLLLPLLAAVALTVLAFAVLAP